MQLNISGIRLGSTEAGIRYQDREDLVVLEIAEGSNSAAIFTKNAFCAAPVTLARNNLATSSARYLLINSGNANAGTGELGMQAAQQSCDELAKLTGVSATQILPFSTGVIGELMPMDKFVAALPAAIENLTEDNWQTAADAILTTDTVRKIASRKITLQGAEVKITGMAKGSGMIRPDMATMLAFVATDAAVSQDVLEFMLQQAADSSFNRISVDGDTSTNDALTLTATGKSAMTAEIDKVDTPEYQQLLTAVTDICIELAQAIVRDGEGATKFVTVNVTKAESEEEALKVAYTIAHSPLVKTALFASDPNWGRLLAAVGRAGVEDLVLDGVQIYLDDVCVVQNGGLAASYTEEQGARVMSQKDIEITVELGRGEEDAQIWTTDLSYDYVKINAEYRS